jgi:mycothiol synthase
MNVLVLSELDDAQLADLAALLVRCALADGHPALAEPQRAAATRRDLGADGSRVVLGYEDVVLIGCAFITPAIDGATALHVAVDPGHRDTSNRDTSNRDTGNADGAESVKTELLRSALEEIEETDRVDSAGRAGKAGKAGSAPLALVRLWIMQATDADDADAARLGFVPERDLLQMQVPLPLPRETVAKSRPVVTRPFEPGRDDEAWLEINNAAFVGHPEQGGWSLEDLHARMTAPWFDREGFLMVDSDEGTELIGSCWTKVHLDHDPVLGEIYVISVNPARHGEGWGRALTVAGLEWMAAKKITVGMLYTTASNTAAVKLYESLGFNVTHVDRSYDRTVS